MQHQSIMTMVCLHAVDDFTMSFTKKEKKKRKEKKRATFLRDFVFQIAFRGNPF